MSRQSDIEEGIRKIILFCKDDPDVCVGEILGFLVRSKVVIKVDRELPWPCRSCGISLDGYEAVEPLIPFIGRSGIIQAVEPLAEE